MLCLRSLDSRESAQPVLGFLTDGQDRFFFDLHRFNSELGREAFQQAKADNAEPLKSLVMGRVHALPCADGRPPASRCWKPIGTRSPGLSDRGGLAAQQHAHFYTHPRGVRRPVDDPCIHPTVMLISSAESIG
ncbi:MAG: hypothetical protein KIS84_07875 [Dokdonella sp.]|nr:hypothetical protein [Dokdonella sp.]